MEKNLLVALAKDIPKLQVKTKKQALLVQTAIRLFALKGYANTSTAEIAAAAGISEGLIFKYYGSKEKLLLAILVPFLQESLPSMANDLFLTLQKKETNSFADFLVALVSDRAAFLGENRAVFQVMVKEVIYQEDLKAELGLNFSRTALEKLTLMIEEYQRKGELLELPSQSLSKILLTQLASFFVTHFLILEQEQVSQAEIQEFCFVVLHGITKNS